MPIKVIAFDADDTLWVNEPYFQETEKEFCSLFEDYLPHHTVGRELLHTEIQNITLYGYGIKGFMLSMIETALKITNKTVSVEAVDKIIGYGKDLLARPIELLDGVEEVLTALKGHYRLVVATKGDLLDQERKLKKSGLEHYFHHIEIMSEKGEADYRKLLKHLDIKPDEFVMIGNSLKSDVLPVLNIGGHGIHVPYHITWAHERIEHNIEHENFRQVQQIKEIIPFLLSEINDGPEPGLH
ncbi:HAD family hydrolase [Rhodocytophaga rosea]|uniref:HAD family hydrolase n=1 Tax=Rhodocytophaga rosea TaxID=2704465 RepID=A0A6C0GQW4_9BACT|nr:HAD family hydrolase [Rhodocytophaga rosea]QHT70475.1 HAD family hydrolase [Rhodocytophaga rosea]